MLNISYYFKLPAIIKRHSFMSPVSTVRLFLIDGAGGKD
jgi:hypothetical protein